MTSAPDLLETIRAFGDVAHAAHGRSKSELHKALEHIRRESREVLERNGYVRGPGGYAMPLDARHNTVVE